MTELYVPKKRCFVEARNKILRIIYFIRILYTVEYPEEYIDWLNKHHFDYRNLIGKGLAIAVTEENNPYR